MDREYRKKQKEPADDRLALLERASNISSMGIHVVDLHTMEMYYCNDAGFRLIEQEPCPYQGRRCYEVFFGADHPCDNCRLDETKRGETRHEVTVAQVNKTFLTNTEITSWDGRDVYVEYITDVTQSNQTKETQRQLMNQLESTSRELKKKYEVEKRRSRDDTSVLAYAVFNLRTCQTIEMERRKPLVPLEQPMTMADFRDDIVTCILSEEQRKNFQRMFHADELLQRYREGIEEQSVEFQRTLPSGKVIWVKSSFHLMAEPDGTDILLFYYCNDINLRKSLQIMTSFIVNEDYDMLGCVNFYDDSAIMLYGKNSSQPTTGEQGIYREENYSASLEWFVNHAVVPEERELYRTQFFVNKIKEQLSRHSRYEFTIHVLSRDGRRLTKKIRYTRYEKESEVCLFAQVDITELVQEEERKQQVLRNALLTAKQANAAKTSFLSRMSHDMRTPMNGILGLAALSMDETDSEVLRDNVRKIKESGDYLLSLINDTLDFQRIESGKMELDEQIVPTQTVLNGILDIIRPAMEKKDIRFLVKNENADLNWYIRLDPVRFKQIFINLLSNAVKFTPAGGTISFVFGCIKRDGMISHDYIRVCDTGIGMSEDFVKNRLFQPFSQESSAVSAQYAGSGLGLSIVHSLVELMGGTIEVESTLGKGTAFTVYLDFERVEREEAERLLCHDSSQLSHTEKQLAGKHILLVEDHPLNAEIARRMLQKVGCIVDWADNGKKGVEAVQASTVHSYDAVLMDIRMPVMDGLAAARAIRALPRADSETLPIIAMTANAYEEDRQQALQAGMNAHLTKPIEPERLYQMLAQYI